MSFCNVSKAGCKITTAILYESINIALLPWGILLPFDGCNFVFDLPLFVGCMLTDRLVVRWSMFSGIESVSAWPAE